VLCSSWEKVYVTENGRGGRGECKLEREEAGAMASVDTGVYGGEVVSRIELGRGRFHSSNISPFSGDETVGLASE
jgi:hypothetical protein